MSLTCTKEDEQRRWINHAEQKEKEASDEFTRLFLEVSSKRLEMEGKLRKLKEQNFEKEIEEKLEEEFKQIKVEHNAYVIYDAENTVVSGIFTSYSRAFEYLKGKNEENLFIKKVPVNCIHHITDDDHDVVWPKN